MKKFGKQAFTLFLCLVMCLSMLSAAAFAEEEAEAALPEESAVADEAAETTLPDAGELPADAEAPAAPEEPVEPDTDAASTSEENGENAAPAPEEDQPDEAAEARPVLVRFALTPEDAELILYTKDEQGEKQEIEPEEDGSYRLLPGLYFYTAACEGFAPVEETELRVEHAAEPLDVDVVLASAPEAAATETASSEPKEAANAVVASGTCGENLTWTLDDEGTLTISGTGAMEDYTSASNVPWCSVRANVTTIVVGQGITKIGSCAFYGCNKATNAIIADGVQSLGTHSFGDCSELRRITIPHTVASIDDEAFEGCRKLDKVLLLPTEMTVGFHTFYGCSELKSAGPVGSECNIEFAWNIEIPENSFSGLYWLKKIIIPESIKCIGSGAFSNCSGIESVTIPDGVTYIADSTFYFCSSLSEIIIPSSVKEINGWAFRGCSSLSEITLPASVEIIGDGAFDSCDNLKNVYFQGTIQQWRINGSAFSSSPLIHCLDIDGVTPITFRGGGACGTNMVWTLDDDGNLIIRGSGSMDDYAYYTGPWEQENVITVTMDDTITSISGWAFEDCSNLRSVKLPAKLREIGERAFYGCGSLESIDIPNGVRTIGYDAFADSGLVSIDIPDSVCDSLSCFNGCSQLKSVRLSNSLRDVGGFNDCVSLTSIVIPEGVQYLGSFTGCTSLASITIPDSVIMIGSFENCTSLKSIQLPQNMFFPLPEGCFKNCSSLSSATLSGASGEIPKEAFMGCSNLKSVVILGGVETIHDSAFEDCTALETVTIPLTVKEIGYYAFTNCPNLKTVTYEGTKTKWNQISIGRGNEALIQATLKCSGYVIGTPRVYTEPGISENNKPKVTVIWNSPDDTSLSYQYRVYRKTSQNGSWTALATVTRSNGYEDKNVSWGNTYIYTVRVMNGSGKFISDFDRNGVSAKVYLDTPQLKSVANTATGVKVTWAKVYGAEKYRVFRKGPGGSWAKVGDTAALTLTDTKAVSGTEYFYTVRCLSSDAKKYTSAFDASGIAVTFIATPALPAVSSAVGGIQVKWTAVDGAEKYRVFRKVSGGSWTKVDDTTETSFLDREASQDYPNGPVSGKTYVYTIRCITADGSAYTSAYNTTGKSLAYIAVPEVSGITLGSNGVTLKWSKVGGAAKYRIFRKTEGGSWAKLADTTAVSYTDKAGSAAYIYTVRCISSDGTKYTSGFNANGWRVSQS